MTEGLAIQVTHLGLRAGPIILSDVYDGTDGPPGYQKAGPVYVPENGSATLIYTTSVAKSFESGSIRGFIGTGDISATFVYGTAAQLAGGFSYGNFATNRLAMAEIISRGDDVGGLPVVGATYYNTTVEDWRTWNGAYWEGVALYGPDLTANVTIYVETPANGGSDVDGDGLTVGTAYATIIQALQDVPLNVSTGDVNIQHTIQCGVGRFDLPSVVGQRGSPGLNIRGTKSVDHSDTIAAVLSDTRDGGRQIQLTTGGLTTDQYEHYEIEVNGNSGIAYQNDANTVRFGLNDQTTYGSLAPGQTVTIYEYDTTLFVDDQSVVTLDGSYNITDCDIENNYRLNLRRTTTANLTRCRIRLTSTARNFLHNGGQVTFNQCSIWWQPTGAAQVNLWLGTPANSSVASFRNCCVFSGHVPGTPTTAGGFNMNSNNGQRWHFDYGEFIWNRVGWVNTADPRFTWRHENPTDERCIIRSYNSGSFMGIAQFSGTGDSYLFLPRIVGNFNSVTLAWFSLYSPELVGRMLVRFMQGTNITGPLADRVYIASISNTEGYRDYKNHVFIEDSGMAGDHYPVYSTAINYTVTDYDGVEQINGTGGAGGIQITLPDPTKDENIRRPPISIVKVDAGVGAVTTTNNVSGAPLSLAAQWDRALVRSDGTQWVRVG